MAKKSINIWDSGTYRKIITLEERTDNTISLTVVEHDFHVPVKDAKTIQITLDKEDKEKMKNWLLES